KELQKRLKNHYSKKEKQVFLIHCSENSFVDIFGQYLTRYSVCGGWYQCFFDEEEAIDQLAAIFDDNKWAERNYGNGQLSWIKLYNNESNAIKKTKKKSYLEGGLLIEWQIRGFSDKAEHRCESGEDAAEDTLQDSIILQNRDIIGIRKLTDRIIDINFGADLNVILGMPPMPNMKSDTEKVENLIEMLKNIVKKN
ncbi:6679_t:CDS:2, partial [Cetraspora pellucida]